MQKKGGLDRNPRVWSKMKGWLESLKRFFFVTSKKCSWGYAFSRFTKNNRSIKFSKKHLLCWSPATVCWNHYLWNNNELIKWCCGTFLYKHLSPHSQLSQQLMWDVELWKLVHQKFPGAFRLGKTWRNGPFFYGDRIMSSCHVSKSAQGKKNIEFSVPRHPMR